MNAWLALSDFSLHGLPWVLLTKAVGAGLATIALAILASKGLKQFYDWRALAWFTASLFAAIFVLSVTLTVHVSRPDFDGAIYAVLTPDYPVNDSLAKNEMPLVYLLAEIVNRGTMPSIAREFRLEMNVNGAIGQGQGEALPERIDLPSGDGKIVTVYSEDSLVDRSAKPIEPGSMLTGILSYSLPDVRKAAAFPGSSVQLTLSFRDVLGTKYTASTPVYTRGLQSHRIPRVPGIRMDIRGASR